ncbi:MAG: hypothetical protein R6U98_25480, partial [Pirellulaceae bacterium]
SEFKLLTLFETLLIFSFTADNISLLSINFRFQVFFSLFRFFNKLGISFNRELYLKKSEDFCFSNAG